MRRGGYRLGVAIIMDGATVVKGRELWVGGREGGRPTVLHPLRVRNANQVGSASDRIWTPSPSAKRRSGVSELRSR
jgi:hypothetical protein